MLKNYLKVALRVFRRNKGYSLLNLSGLVIGLTCFILIMLYVGEELSYDRYHANKERIYRLVTKIEGRAFEALAKVAGAWGPAAKSNIPEVEQNVRFIFFGTTLVQYEDTQAYEPGGLYADSTVFDVFSFELLRGDAKTALSAPNLVVLTRDLASKYFGNADPIGKAVTFDNEFKYTVTGVLENVPSNSHFTFTFLASLSSGESPYWGELSRVKDTWTFYQAYTYLLLRADADPAKIGPKLQPILEQNLESEDAARLTPYLQPLTDIYLRSKLWREIGVNSDISRIMILGAIAIFILLLACINYMNLASARSASRATEVGVRKVVGANRRALVGQLLSESVFVSVLALVIAGVVATLLLPAFNVLVEKNLGIGLADNFGFWLGLTGLTVLVGILSGSYPALVLASLRPVQALKGGDKTGSRSSLRRSLVVFQFAVSIVLMIGTTVALNQMHYIRSKDLGFNKEHLLIIPLREEGSKQNIPWIKNQLLSHPGILAVAASANQPGGSDWASSFRTEGFADYELPPARLLVVDDDFLETYQIEISRGRNFAADRPADVQSAVLINEEAVRQLGWENPIGKIIHMNWWNSEGPVIGVVRDFHFHSMHERIGPLFFFLSPSSFNRLTVRVRGENMAEAIEFMEEKWKAFEPQHPFTYSFFEEGYDALYRGEQQFSKVLSFFAALAMLIACLGLFGLASFTTEQRTKEIGVRKVMGASTPQIFGLFAKEFSRWVVIAFAIACPAAYFLASEWLQNFAYQTTLTPSLFILPGLLSLAIAVMTVSYQSIRSALANPVKALRYE